MIELEVKSREAAIQENVEEARKKDKGLKVEDGLAILSYILMWYGFSISLSVYNKWLFSVEGVDFNYPIFSTSLHQFVQFGVAYLIRRYREDHIEDWDLRAIMPCALASAGDIGMGNLSLRTVTLSFYTMVKSSNLGFALMFSVLFGLERFNWRLLLIILVMSVGVVMMVAGETVFSLIGFLLVMGAACCSGLRWSLTQMLLKGSKMYNGDPINTIYYLSPVMGAIIFTMSMLVEGPINIATSDFFEIKGVLAGSVMLITPGVIAFYMTLSEFYLLNKTSVLSLSIAGIFKELLTITIAYLFFGDHLTQINLLGLVVTLIAICAYNAFRFTNFNKSHN
ncbi:hypothetical protein TRICI_006474 [Trichomonascus ciferrii]|uniref:Sugar phosphate transporter domain-containing protein n=1 Tax=Trichomonascus ciferrii TaxID=44093 RepID=A0A642UH24_9ASCO|nr:hypothetical protein TRICI_006474 [Trichomonascus ciferrii]